jgi:electron transport complex protein RnfB
MPPRVPPEAIEALLPQTQCGKCGYAACRPYAEALARGEADLNRCPPGGEPTIARLAVLLGRAPKPLDPDCGPPLARAVALIDEARCIGCTLCIRACPVDAIVGASKRMHTVLESHCTGCGLCLPPCPVDCILMLPLPGDAGWTQADADAAKARYRARRARLARQRQARRTATNAPGDERARRRAVLAAALERARRKRAARGSRAS